MKCEHCNHNADHYIIFGAMCGKTFALCNACVDILWMQLHSHVEAGRLPWLSIPIEATVRTI